MSTTRCYQCGREISVDEAVRRDVQTGSGYGRIPQDGGIYGHYSQRVDYCQHCAERKDNREKHAGVVVLAIETIQLEPTRILQALPEAVREKIGFKPPAQS